MARLRNYEWQINAPGTFEHAAAEILQDIRDELQLLNKRVYEATAARKPKRKRARRRG